MRGLSLEVLKKINGRQGVVWALTYDEEGNEDGLSIMWVSKDWVLITKGKDLIEAVEVGKRLMENEELKFG